MFKTKAKNLVNCFIRWCDFFDTKHEKFVLNSQACTSSKEEEMHFLLLQKYPRCRAGPLDPFDTYQQFEIVRKKITVFCQARGSRRASSRVLEEKTLGP